MKQNTYTKDSGKPVVIYHKNCMDGLGAAYAFFNVYGYNYEYFPGVYNEPPPEGLEGRVVHLVDFSYPLHVVAQLVEADCRVVVIDHHKSAIEELADYTHPNLVKYMDANMSGTGLAWKYMNGDMCPMPELLRRIQDRDLWLFKYENTKAVHAYLASKEWDLESFHSVVRNGAAVAAEKGNLILMKHDKDVASIIEATKTMGYIDGHYVPIANVPPWLASDVGNTLSSEYAEGTMFSATYFDTNGHRIFSLRSADKGMDVSAIAKKFGGGGHYHAAGFRFPISPVEVKNAYTDLKEEGESNG